MKKSYINILMDWAEPLEHTKRVPDAGISASEAFLLLEKELRRLNSIIRSKVLTDEHFGNNIFKNLRSETSEEEIKVYANDHFTAAYYWLVRLREKMEKEKCFNEIGIKKYGFIINTIIFDVRIFADYVGKKKDSEYFFFIGGKTNTEDSKWHYLGTLQLLYNSIFDKKMLDNKFALILSPVALRQTIELKIQRVLGLYDYYDLKGEKIYTNHYYFFNFIRDNKSHFDLSSNLTIIQKVFDFCNNSVHRGIMPYFWQMMYAEKFCDTLFYDAEAKTRKSFHFHSAVRINNYEELKEKLKKRLLTEFPAPKYDLYLNWGRPEAQLL